MNRRRSSRSTEATLPIQNVSNRELAAEWEAEWAWKRGDDQRTALASAALAASTDRT